MIRYFASGGTRHGLDAKTPVGTFPDADLKKLPSWPAFKRWMELDPEIRSRYARAQKDQASALVDEALHLLRTCTPENSKAVRVQVDGLLRIAAKKEPKVFGDVLRNEHSGPEAGPIKFEGFAPDWKLMTDQQIDTFLEKLTAELDRRPAKTG